MMSEEMMNGAPKTLAPPSPPIHIRSVADNEAGSGSVTEAIYVRHACKSYGVGKRRSNVLRGLDMNVKKGTIYGLLGASGCGKTTLLSCIVGRRSFDSGEVLVFGGEPGSVESGIPGPRVGYMPQELALYGEFTIKETLEYFGRIYRLSPDFVQSQVDFLTKLLDLPHGDRFVKTLSGGQQRRVSFAVALFHEPELLILDEPTVGVDPLLRHKIWNHLVHQSVDHGRTVIITTHYIEEARQADTIGMMRSGRLLAEESPQNLLRNYQLETLEQVFLKLCMKDGNRKDTPNVVTKTNSVVVRVPNPLHAGFDNQAFNSSQFDVSKLGVDRSLRPNHFHPSSLARYSIPNTKSTLPSVANDGVIGLTFNSSYGENKGYASGIDKQVNKCANFKPMNGHSRLASHSVERKEVYQLDVASKDTTATNDYSSNYVEHAAQPKRKEQRRKTFRFAMPSPHRSAALIRKNFMQTFRNIGMFLFIFLLPALQAIIFCLAIGHDPTLLKMAIVNDELDPSQGRICNYTTDCTYSMFSCRYLRFLDNQTIIQVPFKTVSDALEATRMGKVWGVVHFGQNFTDEIMVRQADGTSADNETIIASQIGVQMDYSNQQIAFILRRQLLDAFQDFSSEILEACKYEPAAANIPVTFLDPIYGSKKSSYTEFMAPGMILTIVYFMAVALTSGVFIAERKEGLLDRSLVAGVQISEILLAHVVNQFSVLIGQTVLVFLFMLAVFHIPCEGNLALAALLTLLQGLCGMAFGFLVSSLCDSEISAIHLSLGSFYPTLLLSGIIWPIEGMTSVYMRYISYAMPQTYAIEALRSVFARGWGVHLPDVYAGIFITLAWTFGLMALSLVVIRVRKYTG